MSEQESSHDFFEQVRRDHEELRTSLGRLSQALTNRDSSTEDIAAQLVALIEHLDQHFQDEETGGFFDEVVAQAPRYADRTNALREEHVRLLKQIRGLADAARRGEPSDSWWKELEDGFHDFSKSLMHHENQENELLQDTYDEDVGSKD